MSTIYPEHEKLQAVGGLSQTCGEFLEHLQSEYTLCKPDENGRQQPCYVDVHELLAEFFGIDSGRLEVEKREMLRTIREGSA